MADVTLTVAQLWAVINALTAAAKQYSIDADELQAARGGKRMADQFSRQAAAALELSHLFAGAASVVVHGADEG